MFQSPQKKFQKAYIKQLKSIDKDIDVDIEALFQLKVSLGSKSHTNFLDNAYNAYTNDPDIKDEIIDQYTKSTYLLLTSSDDDQIDRHSIVPIIKGPDYYETMSSLAVENGRSIDDYFYASINDGLHLWFAEDTETSIHYLMSSDLEELDLTIPQLKELAVMNLEEMLDEIKLNGSDGYYMLTAGGNYEASLILFDHIWDSGQIKVEGDYVVALPSRDILLITGSQDNENLEKVRSFCAESYAEETYAISPNLYIRNDNTWDLFQ